MSPFFFNGLEYTIGDKQNKPEKLQRVVLDSFVDIGGTIVTGLVAAVIVLSVAAAAVVIASLVGASLAISVPVLLISALVLGTGLDFGLEISGRKEPIKEDLNNWWDTKAQPVLEFGFNQPAPGAAQPATSIPTPSTTLLPPTSTPTPSNITPTSTPLPGQIDADLSEPPAATTGEKQ